MDRTYNSIREEAAPFRENNDCTVITVATVCGITYAEAHALLKAAGRVNGRGFAVAKYHAVINQLGFAITKIHDLESKTVRTIERELAANFGGCKVMILVRGHALAWNGVEIADWSAGHNHRIKSADLVHPIGQLPEIGKSVPIPERKPLNKTPQKRTPVRIRWANPEREWYSFPSVPAAYRGMNLDLRGAQAVRKNVKRCGSWVFWAYDTRLDRRQIIEIQTEEYARASD